MGTDAFRDRRWANAPNTKWCYQIRRPEEIARAVARAFYIARTGRKGPVCWILQRLRALVTDYRPEK